MRRTGFALRKAEPTARLSVPVFKPKKCKACQERFTPARQMQAVCGAACAISWGFTQNAKEVEKEAKVERRADRAKRESLKKRSDWLREAQAAFNTFIRTQDALRGCISCGTNNGKMNAGHYRSVGANPELRFEPLNVHKQCERCNTHLHGNLLGYRAGLKGRIGEDMLDWLEGPHPAKHYSIDDLRAIKAAYKAKTKELTK